jgi:hypothetical protein
MPDEVRLSETRKYIRHSMDVPFRCVVRVGDREETLGLKDISDGGASFASTARHAPGQAIELAFPTFPDRPVLAGTIAWTRADPDTPGLHRYGVKFDDEKDKKTLRLVEMICHIMTYRAVQEHITGKALSADEATSEWLAKYADTFPE